MTNLTTSIKNKKEKKIKDLELTILKLKNCISFLQSENKDLHEQIEQYEKEEEIFSKGF